MNSPQNSDQKSPHERSAFTGWGTILGALIGTLIGLFAGHWLGWTSGLAFVGWITGALIDRARLP